MLCCRNIKSTAVCQENTNNNDIFSKTLRNSIIIVFQLWQQRLAVGMSVHAFKCFVERTNWNWAKVLSLDLGQPEQTKSKIRIGFTVQKVISDVPTYAYILSKSFQWLVLDGDGGFHHPIPQGFSSLLLKPYIKEATHFQEVGWWRTWMVECVTLFWLFSPL